MFVQYSSKSNKFQSKKAGKEKSGQAKKHKFHQMHDLLCFQPQNLNSRGMNQIESLHVVSQ